MKGMKLSWADILLVLNYERSRQPSALRLATFLIEVLGLV